VVDFARIREERKKQIEVDSLKAQAQAVDNKLSPSWKMRVQHLIEYHLTSMNDWQEGFVYSVRSWLSDDSKIPSEKQQAKIKEMEDEFCTQFCHQMMKNGIPHVKEEPHPYSLDDYEDDSDYGNEDDILF
jgi:hypothetical protein